MTEVLMLSTILIWGMLGGRLAMRYSKFCRTVQLSVTLFITAVIIVPENIRLLSQLLLLLLLLRLDSQWAWHQRLLDGG